MPNTDPGTSDVLSGTLDAMVLRTLPVLGPAHGDAIGARLEQASPVSVMPTRFEDPA